MINIPETVAAKFQELYGAEPLNVRSPGRVNLIGEHTDYNLGLVMPAAINKYIYMSAGKRTDKEIHIYSLDYKEEFVSHADLLIPSGKLWPDYLLGVVDQFIKAGHDTGGINIVFGGDIPQGAGLSSSAALECATGFALNKLFNCGLSRMELAKLAQKAENQFVGVQCGLMDQFASTFGRESSLIKLDCASFEYEYLPFNFPEIKIVLLDTRVHHSLATSAYNQRRLECEQGVALVSKHIEGIRSLRDVTPEMLAAYVLPADQTVYRRCTYVIEEIKRVRDAGADLGKNDLSSFGKRMYESHAGLQHLYEVSCTELDLLVDLVRPEKGVYGARMMGGGFGGCTINLVEAEKADALIAKVSKAYKEQTGLELKGYIATISAGTCEELVKE